MFLSKLLHSQYLVSTVVIPSITPWDNELQSSFRLEDVPAKAIKSELNADIPSSATEISVNNMYIILQLSKSIRIIRDFFADFHTI